MAVKFTANRNYPSIPAITGDVDNHTRVLQAIKEALEIGQRRTNDLLNSFVRVKELIDLGLITLGGDGQWATYKEQTIQKTATWVNGVNPIVAGDAPVVAVHVPVACTIHQAVIVTRGGPGNCVVEVRRTTLGAYGAGTLISNNLGLSSQSARNDTTLTGWTTSLAADDVLLFELVSTSNFNYIHVSLTLR